MEPQKSVDQDIQTRLIGRAVTDANFRQQLLTNGRVAIEQELGTKLPTDLEIQVIEEKPNKLCLVLPMEQKQGELADAALAGVTGGLWYTTLLSRYYYNSFYTRSYTTTQSTSSASSAFETGPTAGAAVPTGP